jgi:hypothetical protein
MSSEPATKKRTLAETNTAIAIRRDVINGSFRTPFETDAYIKMVRAALEEAAQKIAAVDADLPMDVGRFIHALDLLQQAKDTFCVAAIIGAEAKNRAAQK